MTATTQRYQPGGDLYDALKAKYGADAAAQVAAAAIAAESADDPSLIGDALGRIKFGAPLNDSTLSIFGSQIYNEPLTAPLEQVSKITESTVKTIFSFNNWGLWVLLAAAGAYIFLRRR